MAGDSWFRFYNAAVDHPKALMLSDAQFRAWVTLLCLASKAGGIIPDSVGLVAMTLRKSAQKAADILQVLLSAGLLDKVELGYQPHNWNERQFKSDVSTERVKRFRNAKRNGIETDHRQRQSTETESKNKDVRASRFQEFWEACPKKTGKGAAEKAWPKAILLADADTLIGAMTRYAASQAGKDAAYTKTPGPWLNEKRWLDEAASTSPALAFVNTDDRGWRDRLRVYREGKGWAPKWGPDPSAPDCKCPAHILREAA